MTLSLPSLRSSRDAGLRHVIDLTADAETPEFDEASAVRASGLGYSNLPLRGASDLTRDNVLAFDALLRSAKRPVLVHCARPFVRHGWDDRPVEEPLLSARRGG